MPYLASIPRSPGCYLFKDVSGKVIYVGKAKDLKKRVSSYFSRNSLDPKTEQLVKRIDDIDFIATNTEVEALVLENNLIKTHAPKYNIDLKDSKRYAYILLTDEHFPRVIIARERKGAGTFYGPFTSAEQRDYIISLVRKVFRLRTCKRLPKTPCLRYHIRLCDAPCAGLIGEGEYKQNVYRAAQVMRGLTTELIYDLEKTMNERSAEQDFERAKDIRDQIYALRRLAERQTMERQQRYDEDIINFLVRDGRVYLVLFNIYRGRLINKMEFDFEWFEGFFESFLSRHYSENEVPREVIVPVLVPRAIAEYLATIRGSAVGFIVPKRGQKKVLLEIVKKNVELSFFGDIAKVSELGEALKMQETPYVIECFDISHLQGTAMVGSMVQFRNGKPDKANYRRYKIREVSGIDDFAAIAEVVRRRYSRLRKEGGEMPNLIVIDGGKGQLTHALASLDQVGAKIPVISIAKRLEEVFIPGLSFALRFDEKSKALLFLREIRDEAHRFAISYNRLLRKSALTK